MTSKPPNHLAGDGYEPELTDVTLGREIELLADVMAAAGQVVGRLTTAQLDRALGLANQEPASPPATIGRNAARIVERATMATSLEQMKVELGAVMASARPGLQAANALCEACVDLLGVDGAAISVVYDGFSHGTFGASSESSRRLDEYQFTFGEGPCLDAAAARQVMLAPDLDSPDETRWPAFAGAVLGEGIRAVFAMPILIASACVGALDLFRSGPGPLSADHLAGGMLAAHLASLPLLDLAATTRTDATEQDAWDQLHALDRVEVYQATGMLMAQLEVDATEALVRLRAHAIATNQTASQVALAVIERRLELERDDHDDGRRVP